MKLLAPSVSSKFPYFYKVPLVALLITLCLMSGYNHSVMKLLSLAIYENTLFSSEYWEVMLFINVMIQFTAGGMLYLMNLSMSLYR